MYSLRPGTEAIGYFIPASSRYGVVRDPQGTKYSALFPGEDLGSYNFFRSCIHPKSEINMFGFIVVIQALIMV